MVMASIAIRTRWLAAATLGLAVCVGSGLSHIGTSTMPFQIGALIDGAGASSSQAGLFGFLEVGALAISMILISPWVSRFSPFAISMAGCALAALGNVGLFVLPGIPLHLILAAVAGAGYGFVFAATVAGAAASNEPDRLYAIGNSGALLIIVGVMTTLPTVSQHFGTLGIFASLAALACVCTLFMVGFRRGEAPETIQVSAIRLQGAPGLLFAWATFSMGTGGLYAFSERIGQSLHLAPQSIANVLSAGTFIGLIGTGAAIILGKRVNRKLALIVGISGTGLSCLLLGYSFNLLGFAAGVAVYWIFYMFVYSYLLGTAAVLDVSGRLGTLGGGLERLGYGAGAWVGGVMAEHFSYASTGMLGFVGCMAGLALGLPSVFRALNRVAAQKR